MTPTDPEGDGNPSARQNHSLTYDATRGVVVLFGGNDGNSLSDTWEYDGISWKEITPTDLEEDGDPEGGWGDSLVFDLNRDVVVLQSRLGETWEYNGISWVFTSDIDPVLTARLLTI